MPGRGRLISALDALSQLANAALLARSNDTDANESVSGRCYWEAHHGSRHWTWVRAEQVIDYLFWWDSDAQGRGHCELADLRDYHRALDKVRRFEGR